MCSALALARQAGVANYAKKGVSIWCFWPHTTTLLKLITTTTFFSLSLGSFFNYVDQILPTIDHQSTPCWQLCRNTFTITGKSLSETLIFADHGENMSCTEIVFAIRNNFCKQHVLPMFCKNKSFWQRFTCTIVHSGLWDIFILHSYCRGVTVGGAGGQLPPPPPFWQNRRRRRQRRRAGSGGAPP